MKKSKKDILAQRESRALAKASHISLSKIGIIDYANFKKRGMLLNPAVKKQLRDYIFGNGENPFEDITMDMYAKLDEKNEQFEELCNLLR